MILGYEDLTIKELEELNYIKLLKQVIIKYSYFWYDFESKQHKYYPDIYLHEKY